MKAIFLKDKHIRNIGIVNEVCVSDWKIGNHFNRFIIIHNPLTQNVCICLKKINKNYFTIFQKILLGRRIRIKVVL